MSAKLGSSTRSWPRYMRLASAENRKLAFRLPEMAPDRMQRSSITKKEMLAAYEGRYWSDEMEVAFQLVVEDGVLVARSYRLPPITLEPGGPDAFAAGVVGTLEFKRAGNGEVTGFMVDNDRTKDVWFERDWVPGG